MSYREEERTRLRRQFSKQAITLAMQGQWAEAVAINKFLLENFPSDVDAYNRLGRAYMELGEYSLAREAYAKAIELDAHNTIARRNLARLSLLGETAGGAQDGIHVVEPEQFIEEIGKAGAVKLCRLAPPATLAKMVAGDGANLKIDGSNLIVENSRGEYLGQVEPRYGQRLLKLMAGGNKYTGTIISSTEEAVTVLIREVYQHPSQAGRLSFPPKGVESFRPFLSERMLRHDLDYEEAVSGEPGYSTVEGEETELLSEEAAEVTDEIDNEE